MTVIKIVGPQKPNKSIVNLPGSKSISNRVLIIRSLCKSDFEIFNISNSDDTIVLNNLLSQSSTTYDAGHAGTSFRFMTAFLSIKNGVQILTGSTRMLSRPIGALVDALTAIGADIEYLGKVGYPPLKIKAFKKQQSKKVTIHANVSSQFISALCLIAPCLPDGLEINLEGKIVSKPYVEMTLTIMEDFGIPSFFGDNIIKISNQHYVPKNYTVESDWSAAGYFYNIVSMLEGARVELGFLSKNSLQGDSEIAHIGNAFGVCTTFEKDRIVLTNQKKDLKAMNISFLPFPDLAQTVIVLASLNNVEFKCSGLDTLTNKETDRILALQQELSKLKVQLRKVQDAHYEVTGNIQKTDEIIETFNDHRMAMSFATIASLFPIKINEPKVVSKSYPNFWKDLETLGFKIISQ